MNTRDGICLVNSEIKIGSKKVGWKRELAVGRFGLLFVTNLDFFSQMVWK
jgi:hypothetical protein